VMELVQGISLAHLDLESWSVEDRRRLADRISRAWMAMVFDHGVFHADPHPANILVRSPDHIGLIDFGMVGQLSERDRESAVRLLADVVDLDSDALPRRLRALGVRGRLAPGEPVTASALGRVSAEAELIDPGGLGGFGWLLQQAPSAPAQATQGYT